MHSAKEILKQRIKEAKVTDSFWSVLHRKSILYNCPIDGSLLDQDELEVINSQRIQNLAREIFENTPVIRISLFPES